MAEISTKTGTISTSTMPNRREVDGELRDRLGVGRGTASTDKTSRRAKVAEVIKTLLWVIPLTVLIWVYAEREQLQKDQEITQVPMKLKSTASDRMVMLNNPAERITLVLNGPQAGINKVREILSESGVALDVEVSDDLQLPFDGEIALAERIARNSLFAKEAVTVVRTKPATVKIKAQKKVTVSVKVQMRPDDRATVTDVKFTPEEITLDVPDSLGPTTRPDALPVYANLKALIDKGQGTHTAKVSVVFAPEQSAWTIPAPDVMATVTIKASRSYKLPSIPIWVRIPAYVLQEDALHFSFDPPTAVVRDVEVMGPAKAVDELEKRIQDRTFTALAIVDISRDDLSKLVNGEGSFAKKLGPKNYEMPEDLAKDLKVTSPISEITVTVTKKGV